METKILFLLNFVLGACAAPYPHKVQNYLLKYRYLRDDELVANLSSALADFQRSFDLPQTGRADAPTLNLMGLPRCGNSDESSSQIEIALARPRQLLWSKSFLRWTYVESSRREDSSAIRAIIADAFRFWSSASRFRFEEARITSGADIRISFERGDHGDDRDFDGPGGDLGHAFFPWSRRRGQIHLDRSEPWSFADRDLPNARNLFSTLAHEIGHTLGIRHQISRSSIMFPIYQFWPRASVMGRYDAERLTDLYGNVDFSAPSNLQNYTVLTHLRGELFMFRGSEFWRYRVPGERSSDVTRLFEFPDTERAPIVLGAYDRFDGRIALVTSDRYYLFDPNRLVPGYPRPLSSYGIDDPVTRVLPINRALTYFVGTRSVYKFNEYAGIVADRVDLDSASGSSIDESALYGFGGGGSNGDGRASSLELVPVLAIATAAALFVIPP